MDLLASHNLLAIPTDLFNFVRTPLEPPLWTDWRDFWLGKVFSRHYILFYFLPLLMLLLMVPARHLRRAIVLTAVAFLAYVFGVLYALFWLLLCGGLYVLSERFARECRRTDVWPMGPPIAAMTILGGGYLFFLVAHEISLPVGVNAWLHANVPWVYPLGARGLAWEPVFPQMRPGNPEAAPSLIHTLFWDLHFVGVAYLAVRMLHYFSELKRDTIPGERRSLLSFMAYVCYVPGLIQGPIDRYTPFQDEIDTCAQRRSWHNLPPAVFRMGMGLIKSLVATIYLRPLLWYQLGIGADNRYWLHPEQIESLALLYFGVFLIIFTLYIEFSGYCDVAIGMSRLLGYRHPENFAMPWRATSMRDFWRRWHITLSMILRDYVYIALGGNRRHVTINLCITFFLCGIWHRLIFQVGLWGIVMGLMVAANQAWVNWMKSVDAREDGVVPAIRRGWLRCRPLPQVCAWLVTQHAFVFSLLIFFGGAGAINVVREILRRLLG